MRRQLLFLAILVAATKVYALSPPAQQQVAAEAVPEVESDSDESASKKSSAPASSFTPSEKIEADSAVSFPVDI